MPVVDSCYEKVLAEMMELMDNPPDHDCLQETGVTFDQALADRENLSASEVQMRWPRKRCPKCSKIIYASTAHMVYGAW